MRCSFDVKESLLRVLALSHDWIIHADVDEHHVYPEDVTAFLGRCDWHGINVVMGELQDRVAR